MAADYGYFPWTHTGEQFQRTWPIGENDEVLTARWKRLVDAVNYDSRTKLLRILAIAL
jgi:hypothetical protein